MAVYNLFPKTLIYRGHLSGWAFSFSIVPAGAWCLQGAQCVPRHGFWQPR